MNKVVNVQTEFQKGKPSDLLQDVLSVSTLGAIPLSGSTDRHVATVTRENGDVRTGSGATKDEAIRRALR